MGGFTYYYHSHESRNRLHSAQNTIKREPVPYFGLGLAWLIDMDQTTDAYSGGERGPIIYKEIDHIVPFKSNEWSTGPKHRAS